MSALDQTNAEPEKTPDKPATSYIWQCSDYFGCGKKSQTSYVTLSCPNCGGPNIEHIPGG